MSTPTGFKRRLRTELVGLIETAEFGGSPRPTAAATRRTRRWGLAAAAGLAAVTAVALVALVALATGPSGEPGGPATAMPSSPSLERVGFIAKARGDGTVEVGFWSPEGAEGLQRALDGLGVPASVVVATRDCAEHRPVNDIPPGEFFAGSGSRPGTILVRPAAMPAGGRLLILWTPFSDDPRTSRAFMISSSRPTCIRWPGGLAVPTSPGAQPAHSGSGPPSGPASSVPR